MLLLILYIGTLDVEAESGFQLRGECFHLEGLVFIALWNEHGPLDQTDLNNGGDQSLRLVEECERRPR